MDEGVVETLHIGLVAPVVLGNGTTSTTACSRNILWRILDSLGELEEALDVLAIRRLVQDDLFAELPALFIDVLVARQSARVHDGHVQALRDGVVEEDGVHGVAQRVQATEGERQIAEAAAEGHAWARPLDLGNGVDEVNAVAVVLWETRRNGQHVAVEDDVLWREVTLLT